MLDCCIADLVYYGLQKELLQPEDEIYTINRLLDAFGKSDYAPERAPIERPLEEILAELLDQAAARSLINGQSVTERDLFDAKLMNLLMPRPSEVIGRFWTDYAVSPQFATDRYYQLSGDSNYIHRYRIAKDVKWKHLTKYGELDITINLSKPEKDPRAIAAARQNTHSGYPPCALCKENEGYAGHMNAAARANHRLIPIRLAGESWFLQYSPYVYYNEHCIVLRGEHVPMRICKNTFVRLLDFTEMFPHYFLGSNADLPIVGGSILTHDHFQGGRYPFAMERAPISRAVEFRGFSGVRAGLVKWPMSVLRLTGGEKTELVRLASKILSAWRGYTDPSAFIFAETNGEPHNTVTPIARRRGADFELDLVLRNNITTDEHPLGVYHPHAELHHIKKENIGLIEVMGLAVLPARLKEEMSALKEAILAGRDLTADPRTAPHAAWAAQFMPRYSEITDQVIEDEIGQVFCTVLEHAGVYKNETDFLRFVEFVNRMEGTV